MNDRFEIPTENGHALLTTAQLKRLARYMADEDDRVLGIGDVVRMLPWSKNTVMQMVRERRIPMIWIEGRWVIVRKIFRRVCEDEFPYPTGRVFRTKERKLAELKPITREILNELPIEKRKAYRKRLAGLI